MALFKISKGNSSNLSSQTLTEGFCWFTPDDGKFYIDAIKDSVLTRIPLNAKKADTADAWTTGQKVYVNLGSADKTKTISGGSATAQEIGVDGTLSIANGGTGAQNAIDARTNLGLKNLATQESIKNHAYTPAGTISRPTFTGSSLTSTGTMIPAGVNSASAVIISPKTTSVYSITSVGSVTTGSAAILTMTVSNEVLSFSWTTNTPTSVTMPTRTQVTGLWNGYNTGVNNTYAAAQTFEGATCNVSVTGTPAGTISIPTFTGTAATLSHTTSAT